MFEWIEEPQDQAVVGPICTTKLITCPGLFICIPKTIPCICRYSLCDPGGY